MEATPDIPDGADDTAPPESGYGAGNRVLAGAMLAACLLLSGMFLDILTNGRLVRALAAPDTEVQP